jgi:hypothetical protein
VAAEEIIREKYRLSSQDPHKFILAVDSKLLVHSDRFNGPFHRRLTWRGHFLFPLLVRTEFCMLVCGMSCVCSVNVVLVGNVYWGWNLPPGEQDPGTHFVGSGVDPITGLDVSEKKKSCPVSNRTREAQPVARGYTYWAITTTFTS